MAGHWRFVCVSDTHNRHDKMTHKLPQGDVLLHAGDFSNVGDLRDVERFSDWLGSLKSQYKHIVVIAGNHDLPFDRDNYPIIGPSFHKKKLYNSDEVRGALKNCIYLEDSEVTLGGIRIYGSPWQPTFCDWAFNVERGDKILKYWLKIPAGVDILMTHGPPLGHGDLCSSSLRAGCVDLLDQIQNRIRPKYHVFGHIHEGHGMTTDGTTTYVNASICSLSYRPEQAPIVFDLPTRAAAVDNDDASPSSTTNVVTSVNNASNIATTSESIIAAPAPAPDTYLPPANKTGLASSSPPTTSWMQSYPVPFASFAADVTDAGTSSTTPTTTTTTTAAVNVPGRPFIRSSTDQVSGLFFERGET